MVNPITGLTQKETDELIRSVRRRLRCNFGYDSVSFIKIERNKEGEFLIFNVKAKNNCGYKSCNVDEDFILNVSECIRIYKEFK